MRSSGQNDTEGLKFKAEVWAELKEGVLDSSDNGSGCAGRHPSCTFFPERDKLLYFSFFFLVLVITIQVLRLTSFPQQAWEGAAQLPGGSRLFSESRVATKQSKQQAEIKI